MLGLYKKILTTPRTVIPISDLFYNEKTLVVEKEPSPETISLFSDSLAIREVDAGSSGAEEEELKALGNAYYDVERFGIHFVASPRHADMLLVTGPVTRNMENALRRTYDATPDPKIVVAVGDAAINGGIYKDSPDVVGGVARVVPVNFCIPGDPPTAKNILIALLMIMGKLTPENSRKTKA